MYEQFGEGQEGVGQAGRIVQQGADESSLDHVGVVALGRGHK
jgi:hypothetical protein